LGCVLNLSLTIPATKTPRFLSGNAAIGPNQRLFRALQIPHRSIHFRTGIAGSSCATPTSKTPDSPPPPVALAALIASAALAIGTVVAATAVSVGIARASAVDGVIDNEGSLFAVALLLGLIFVAIGGLAIRSPRRHRH
jgi:hypothetical protein